MKGVRILFRVDADNHIGSGHLYECLELARYLDARALFCIRKNLKAQALIRHFGFSSVTLPAGSGRAVQDRHKIAAVMKSFKPHIAVVDIPSIRPQDLNEFFASGQPLIIFNAVFHPIRMGIHITSVFAPLPANKGFSGPGYILLRKAFKVQKPIHINKEIKNVLLLFGGADPHNFTLKALKALDRIPGNFGVNIVAGKFFKFKSQIRDFLEVFSKPVHLYSDITDDRDLIRVMKKNDLAIVSGGYTFSELLHLGVPCIVLSQNNVEHKKVFPNFPPDTFIYAGRGTKLSVHKLWLIMGKFFRDYPARKQISLRGRGVVDGKGLQRVAKIIKHALEK